MALRPAVRVCFGERHHLQTTPPTLPLRGIPPPEGSESAHGFASTHSNHTHRTPPTKRVATSEILIFSKRVKKNMKLT